MFQIAIDTDTMPVSPAVYADESRWRALPTVLPLVQGFRGNLRVYFLGEHAPSENAAVALYLRALQSKENLVQTGLGTRGISDAGNVYYDVPLAADTTALSAVLGNRENVIMRAGIVANDVTASPQTNFEWQLNIAVSASAVGTGEKPPVSPNAIDEHNNDVAAHPFILQKIAAAEVDVSGLRASIAGVSENLNATNTNLNNAKSELSTEISEVSASLSAEIIARENADAELRAALTEEQGARSGADSELSEAIESEANRRFSENSILRNLITGETTARKAADANLSNLIATEKSERQSEDSELRSAISEETTARIKSVSELRSEVFTEISNVSAALAAETIARENEDAAIRAALESETNERKDAVSSISENVAAVYSELNASDAAIRSALESETTARSEAIEEERNELVNTATHLQNAINSERAQRSQNDAQLSSRILAEANCRIAADSEIRAALTEEQGARSEADSELRAALSEEATARANSDTDLQGLIATETSERGDADSELRALIESEATARTEGDNALNAAILSEANARSEADVEQTIAFKEADAATNALVASNTARLDALEAKFPVLGLGWFKPDSSVEADSTAGRLDDKRRILIGLDKTGKVSMLKYGSFGSDGLWHDNTGVYAGIYVKRYNHEAKTWKTPVPAPHATGKTYAENTLDTMGILPWAGIRDAVLPDEINGVAFEQHVVKIPQFRFAKKYHVAIRWKSEASSTGYVDETGELKIALAEPPAEAFSIGFDADGTGTGVVTLTPEDFPVHDAFVVPDGSGGTREIDHIAVAKYFGTQLNCGGTQVMTSRPIASRNSAPNRGQATQYCENGNIGMLGARYTECNSTAAQIQLIVDLMEVEFATRDIQSVNTGATKYYAEIGMNYTQEWQHCNAENLDDFERRGLEGIRASGWVDYYGKLKTEYDRASNPDAAETQSTGKEFLTRFCWRGIEGGLFCSMISFVSDMEIMCYANEEIPASLIGADFAQELVAAGVATEDAETGVLTAVSGGCHIIAIRNPETPLSQIYRGTGGAASDRNSFISNYIATGKYRVVELVAPTVQGGTQYFENIPYGMEFPQKTANESDGRVHGVDYGWWANASVKMRRLTVGGSCAGNTSNFGLRCVVAGSAASHAYWAAGSRACFIPSLSEE